MRKKGKGKGKGEEGEIGKCEEATCEGNEGKRRLGRED